MQLKAIVAGALGFVGVLLLNWGFANDTARLTRIPYLSAGLGLFLSSITYLSLKTKSHLLPQGLKILDLALTSLCLIMIPILDLLSGEVLWWVFLVVSCLGARLIITWLLKGRMKSP